MEKNYFYLKIKTQHITVYMAIRAVYQLCTVGEQGNIVGNERVCCSRKYHKKHRLAAPGGGLSFVKTERISLDLFGILVFQG